MNKTTLLGCALGIALSAPAMAGDFYALAGLQGATPVPLQNEALAATEGGAICVTPNAAADTQLGPTGGGVCLAAAIVGVLGSSAQFSVANSLDVTVAQFLQVGG